MTKFQMETRMQEMAYQITQLERKLFDEQRKTERLESAVKVVKLHSGRSAVAVDLSRDELDTIREPLGDVFCRQFDGCGFISGSYSEGGVVETTMDNENRCGDTLLPGYAGFIVRATWDNDEGTHITRIWGLKKVS